MKAFYHDGSDLDQRELHDSGEAVTDEELAQLGVLAYHFDSESKVDALAAERNYVNRDVITISPTALPEYESKIANFYSEHLHEDEEIRYILDGDGFFDVRNQSDRWVRCHLFKGDLLILPAGIYHRFTTSSSNYIKAMRLFQAEPKWVPHNRPCDDMAVRSEYLKSVSA